MKILHPTVHGLLDYGLASAFLLMPLLVVGFPAVAGVLAFFFGATYLILSAITRYPLGAFKLIPFRIHGVLEAIMAVVWIASPWLFGFAAQTLARNFYVIAGVVLLLVVALTDYKAVGARAASSIEDRRLSPTD
jgi:hypothetical protein